MSGELLHKLITTKGKRIIYKNTQQESYFYEVSKYVIELYYDWNKYPSRGIRVFSTQGDNKFSVLHLIRGHSEVELCNKLFDLLNETNNLWNCLSNNR